MRSPERLQQPSGEAKCFASSHFFHEPSDAGDQASAEEEEEQDSGEWAAEEEWRRSEQCRECVSTDRDEELSDVQDSDEEEHYKRSGRRFGYNPDNDDAWAEYQAVKEDDLFAW